MDVGCSAFGFLCICAARSFWSCRRRAHRHRTHRRQSWDQRITALRRTVARGIRVVRHCDCFALSRLRHRARHQFAPNGRAVCHRLWYPHPASPDTRIPCHRRRNRLARFRPPRLQMRTNSVNASLILGVLWAGWHLANGTIPGLQYYWTGFPAFLFFVVAQTVLFTWIVNHARGSILLAWIFHASINASNSLLFIGEQVTQWVFVGIGFALIALIVYLREGPELGKEGRDVTA